jgi:hypothetical protein
MCRITPEVAGFIKDSVIPLLTVVLSALIAYYISERVVRAEIKKGRVLLQTFAQRYFISFGNSFDLSTGLILDDELSKKKHMAELEAILTDFSSLFTNAFYQRLIDKTPRLIKCQVSARRELIEHKSKQGFLLNSGTATDFAELYRESRIGKKNRLLIEDIVEIVEAMKPQETKKKE